MNEIVYFLPSFNTKLIFFPINSASFSSAEKR